MMARKQAEDLSYGIIGLGRFGSALASTLAEAGKEIMVLDCNEEKVRQIRNFTEHAYVVKDLQKETLRETGIQNCDVVVVCIGDKVDVSILTTLNVINLGVPQVVAKANSPEQGEILEKIGAQVVYPERDMAVRLAHRLEAVRMLDFIQLSEKLNISKMIMPERSVGKTVVEANLRGRFGVNIIAVENDGKLIETITPDYAFKKGDIAYISGSKEALNRLSEWNGKA